MVWFVNVDRATFLSSPSNNEIYVLILQLLSLIHMGQVDRRCAGRAYDDCCCLAQAYWMDGKGAGGDMRSRER